MRPERIIRLLEDLAELTVDKRLLVFIKDKKHMVAAEDVCLNGDAIQVNCHTIVL